MRSFVTGALATLDGELYCKGRTTNSITIGYNFSDGDNVSLFRKNTRINTWNSSNASGSIIDEGLSDDTSYRYYLRNGRSSNSPLINSVTCTTKVKEVYSGDISVKSFVKKTTDTEWGETVTVSPGAIVDFRIEVRSIGTDPMNNVIVRNIFSDRIKYYGNLRVDGSLVSGNVETGLNIGTISAGDTKIITFEARVFPSDSFGIGSTNLVNSVFVSSGEKIVNDTTEIFVVKGIVAGVATEIKTGITNNILLISFSFHYF